MTNPQLQLTCVGMFPVPALFELWLHSDETLNEKSLFRMIQSIFLYTHPDGEKERKNVKLKEEN